MGRGSFGFGIALRSFAVVVSGFVLRVLIRFWFGGCGMILVLWVIDSWGLCYVCGFVWFVLRGG